MGRTMRAFRTRSLVGSPVAACPTPWHCALVVGNRPDYLPRFSDFAADIGFPFCGLPRYEEGSPARGEQKVVERDCVAPHAVLIAPGLWLASPKNGNISNV